MTAKQRIKQLEKAKAGKPDKFIIWRDPTHAGGLAEFDGVEMTQAEAKAKAASLPESVFLIRIEYVDTKDGDHDSK